MILFYLIVVVLNFKALEERNNPMDTKLVIQAKKHDKEAFVKLIEDNQASMYKAAIAILQNDEDAADAIQETILICWEKIGSLRHAGYFKTWLMRIAINVCRDYQRKRWFRHIDMRHALEDLPQGMMTVLPEDRELMLDILRLPDDLKKPLILYYYQDMNLQETADALGISKSTVHTRLKKAEQALKLSLTGGDCYV